MTPPRAVWLLPMLGLATAARAEREGFDASGFWPRPGADRVLSLEGSEVAPRWTPYGGLWLHYFHNPLDRETRAGDDSATAAVVEHRLLGHLSMGVGLFDWVDVDVSLPVMLLSTGEVEGAGVGDLAFRIRGVALRRDAEDDGFGLGFGVTLTAPTGDPAAFAGDGGVTVGPNLAMTYGVGPAVILLNVGLRFRTDEGAFANLALGHELTYGLGVDLEAHENVRVGVEVVGRTSLTAPWSGKVDSPLEIAAGPRFRIFKHLWLDLAAAAGVVGGYGTPDFRVLTGVQWAPMSRGPSDRDRDRILDDADDCPDDAEDRDGHEDDDGCPELDNDKDGVADRDDGSADDTGFGRCRDVPEDRDGFQDDDGCPEADNDQDGVPDRTDGSDCSTPERDQVCREGGGRCQDGRCVDEAGFGLCKNDREDPDGWEDDDGCPDNDNDGDGFVDEFDGPRNPGDRLGSCRDYPETRNNFMDDDGCPDSTFKIFEEPVPIEFKFDAFAVQDRYKPMLDDVAEVLKSQTQVKRIEVQGHTDDRGAPDYNRDLSLARATAVVQYLVFRGVPEAMLTPVGHGEACPVWPGKSEGARRTNRRVNLFIVDPVPAGPTPKLKWPRAARMKGCMPAP